MTRVLLIALGFIFCASAQAAEPKLVSTESKPGVLKGIQALLEEKSGQSGPKTVKKLKIDYPAMTEEEKKDKGEIKLLQGRVSAANNFGLAVEYGDGTREMWADFMKDTKLEGIKKLRDISEGDTVELTYKELQSAPKKLLQKVKLLKRKPKEALESIETEPAAQ